jgi:hypothetical protein
LNKRILMVEMFEEKFTGNCTEFGNARRRT